MILVDDLNQIDPNTFLATTTFNIATDDFLADHILDGECLVPAAIMLELMAECGHAVYSRNNPIVIEDFKIIRRIKIDRTRVLKIHIQQEDVDLHITICADFVSHGRVVRKDVVYAVCWYRTEPTNHSVTKDLFRKESLNCFHVNPQDLYCSKLLHHGPFFQGLGEQLCLDERYFQGIIRKKRELSFLVEPILLDNCLQLIGLKHRLHKDEKVLPIGLEHLCFTKKLTTATANCYGALERYTNHICIHRFIVCDEAGDIIMSASGVRQQSTGQSQLDLKTYFQERNH